MKFLQKTARNSQRLVLKYYLYLTHLVKANSRVELQVQHFFLKIYNCKSIDILCNKVDEDARLVEFQ